MNSFIKSRKLMNKVFFGYEIKEEHRKIISKAFEIFCHALKLPEDSNFCYKCPSELSPNKKEDDFPTRVEYSIIDGIQMGCRTQENKTEIKAEYFQEELVNDVLVEGIEAKDRTFLSKKSFKIF